jgi:NADH-quinone oxidoreductase subunit H
VLELWNTYGIWTAWTLVYIVLIIVGVLLSVAYLTYAERKVLGGMQRRQGPITVGPFGLLQPIADGLKLFSKETVIPSQANRVVFLLAPVILFALSLMAWAVIPFDRDWVLANINVGILYLFAVSSMGVYGVIMAGWASNSRYAFLGGLRSASQMVSYEVSMGLDHRLRSDLHRLAQPAGDRPGRAPDLDAGAAVPDADRVPDFHSG